MLISTNRHAVSYPSFTAPRADQSKVTLLAPGDVYVPSEPNAVSFGASGAALGALAGGGLSLLAGNLGFGGAALTLGLVLAGGVGGAFAGVQAFEATQQP